MDERNIRNAIDLGSQALWSKTVILCVFFICASGITCEYMDEDLPGRTDAQAYEAGKHRGQAEALEYCTKIHHEE